MKILPILFLSVLLVSDSLGEAPSEEANRYHQALLKRPAPGALFDRFYNSWLATGTNESLQQFLHEQAAAVNTVPHQLILAYFYKSQRDYQKALDQFQEVLELDPNKADVWYEKAEIEARVFNFGTAIDDLNTALKTNPEESLAIEIRKLQGSLLVRNSQRDEALTVWKQLLSDFPEDDELHEDIIELQIAEGLLEEALQTSHKFASATEDVYQWVMRTLRTGDIYQLAHNREAALASYSSTLGKIGSGTWLEKEVLAQIDKLYRKHDDLTGLSSELERLSESYPQRITLKERLAQVSRDMGDSDLAIGLYEEIVKLTPGDRGYRESFANLLASLGKVDRAIEQMQQLIAIFPDDSELHIRIAELYHRSGDAEETADAIQQYVRTSDKTEYTYLRAARLLDQFQLDEAAKEQFKATTKAFPDSTSAKEAYAAYLYKKGATEEAVALCQKAAEGKDDVELQQISRFLSSRGEIEAAFKILHGRYTDFSQNSSFLADLCDLAISLERFHEAFPWARARVRLSKTPTDLEIALEQMIRIAGAANQVSPLIEELKGSPNLSVQDQYLLAVLYEKVGDVHAAKRTLDAMTSSDPKETHLIAAQRVTHFITYHSSAEAAEAMEALLASPGGLKSVHVEKAVSIYRQLLRFEQALQWTEEWKKLSPGSPRPWLVEAEILSEQGKTDKALEGLSRAVQLFHDDLHLRSKLASFYVQQGKLEEAYRTFWHLYQQSEPLSSKLPWINQLVKTATSLGTLPDLIETFEERRLTNRGAIEPLLALAELHRLTYNYEGRRQALLEATRIKPDDVELLYEIARIEELEGDWKAALKTLESAHSLDNSEKAIPEIARLHLNYGGSEDGFRIIRDLTRNADLHPRTAEDLALALVASSHWPEAIGLLSPLVEKYPQDYRLGYLYAISLEEYWQTEQALTVFTHLITIEEEIPGSSPPQSTTWADAETELRRMTPDGYMDLKAYLNHHQDAYFYRHYSSRRIGNPNLTSINPSAVIRGAIPQSVDQLKMWVVPHLAEMSIHLSDAERSSLYQRLAARGMPYPELILSNNYDRWDEAMRNHPEDLAIPAAWVLHEMGSQGYTIETYDRIFDLLKKSHPELALSVAIDAASRFPDHTPALINNAITSLNLTQPTLANILKLEQLIAPSDGSQRSLITNEVRSNILSLFEKWHNVVEPAKRFQLFRIRGNALREEETRGAELIRLLDEEIAYMEGRTPPSHSQSSYPPNPFDGLRSFFDAAQHIDPAIRDMIPRRGNDDSPPIYLLKDLEEAKDPFLKALIAYAADDIQLAKGLVEKLLIQETYLLSAHLMDAVLAYQTGDHNGASERFAKAQQLHPDAKLASLIEATLVLLSINPIADEATVERGKQAALRLRHSLQSPKDLQELAAALATLGLVEEANRLSSIAQVTPQRRSRVISPARNHISNTLDDLMSKGQVDQAAELIVQKLRPYLSNHLHTTQSNFTSNEVAMVIDLVKQHGLESKVVTNADPRPTNDANLLGQFGMICEFLGNHGMAQDAYGEALKLSPDLHAVRLRLLTTTIYEESDEAAALLRNIPHNKLNLIGPHLVDVVLNAENLNGKFNAVRAVIDLLKHTKDEGGLDLEWCLNLAAMLHAAVSDHETHLPSLSSQQSLPNEDQPLLKERRELHEQLCVTLLSFSSVTYQAYTHLTTRYPDEKDTFTDDHHARLTLLTMADDSTSDDAISIALREGANARTPEDTVVEHGWNHEKLEELSETFIPQLREKGKRRVAENLEKRITLYTCPANDFLTTAAAFLDEPQSSLGVGLHLSSITRAWELRGLNLSLLPLIEQRLQVPQLSFSLSDWIPSYALSLSRHDDPKAVADLFETLARHALSEDEATRAKIFAHFNADFRNPWTFDSSEAAVTSYIDLMNRLSHDPLYFFPVLEELYRYELHLARTFQMPTINTFTQPETDDVALINLLINSPYLGSAEDFRLYPAPEKPNTIPLSALLDSIKSDERKRTAISEFIVKHGATTFGSDILLAYLDQDHHALAEHLAESLDVLQSLPEEHQDEIALFVDAYYPKETDFDGLSSKGAELLSVLRARSNRGLEETVEEFLSGAWPKEDSPSNAYVHTEELVRYLLGKHDIKRVRQVLQRYAELTIEKDVKGSFKGNPTDLVRLLNALISNPPRDPANADPYHWVGVVLEIILYPWGKHDVGPDRFALRRLLDPLRAELRTELAVTLEAGGNVTEAFQRFYKRLSSEIMALPCAVFGPSFSDLFAELHEDDIPTVITWLDNEVEPSFLSEELSMAARLRLDILNAEIEPNADLSIAEQHYLSSMHISPAAWPLAIGESLLGLTGSRTHPVILIKTAECLNRALRSPEIPLQPTQLHLIFQMLVNSKGHDDSAWRSTAEALTESLLRSRERAREAGRAPEYTEFLKPILQLSILCKAPALTARVVEQESESLLKDTDSLILLIENGDYISASALLGSYPSMIPSFPEHIRYSSEFEKKLELLLLKIDDRTLSYFTEVLFKTVPDSITGFSEETATRTDRIKSLAQNFRNIQFTDSELKDRCLEILIEADMFTAVALRESIEERLKTVNIPYLVALTDERQRTRETHFILAQFALAALELDPSPFLAQLRQLSEDGVTLNASHAALTGFLIEGMTDAIIHSWSNWNPDTHARFIPVIKQILALPIRFPKLVQWHTVLSYSNLAYLSHMIAGQNDEFDTWYHSFPPDVKDQIASGITVDEVLKLFATAYPQDNDRVQDRLDLLQTVLNHPLLSQKADSRRADLEQIIRLGILSKPNVILHRDRLLAMFHASPTHYASIAEILAAEDQTDDALDYWNRAMALLDPAENWQYFQIHMNKLTALHHAGRPVEALLTFESIDWSAVSPNATFLAKNQFSILTQACADAGLPDNPTDLAIYQLQQDPKDSRAWLALSFLYQRESEDAQNRGDLDEAASYKQLAQTILERVQALDSREAKALKTKLAGESSIPRIEPSAALKALRPLQTPIPAPLEEWLKE